MNILQNNPYRLLGVYSNSPTKERLANHNRIKAFLKVGKPVSFPLDLPKYLSPINRTDASVTDAEAKLTLPKEQILYAQFWFVKITPLDDIAFNYLLAGKMDKAEDIWQKRECASSLQNQIMCALMSNNYDRAISYAELLYDNAQHLSQLTSAIIGTSENFDTSKLAFSFLDVLYDEIDANKLLSVITNATWRKHIEERAVKPLIDNIQDAINTAKKSKGKGPDARLNAGEILKKNTQNALSQLKGFLSPTDLQYQMIADKLGLEILQCGIDYYNDSEESDAAIKAMSLQKYALSIVVGQAAKDRCRENVATLQKIIDNLPPLEVLAEDKAIKASLAVFAIQPELISNSIQLIKDCAPHIVRIKEKIGTAHPYYIKISTTIVNNALGNVIAEVNEAQKSDFSTLKTTLISAWRAQLYMDKFDLEPEYKEGRYKECRETLHEIISKCKGFDDYLLPILYQYGCGWCNNLDVSDVDLRTEDEYYQSCNSLFSYKSYIERHPYGKYVARAKLKIEKLTFQVARTTSDFQKFINEYPNSKLVTKAKEELSRLKKKEEEQRVRQEKAINSCRSTDDVVSLYNKEKAHKIDIEKCSLRAFELAKCKKDYSKVTSIFGISTSGGKKANTKVEKIEKNTAYTAAAVLMIISLIVGCIWQSCANHHDHTPYGIIGLVIGVISFSYPWYERSGTGSEETLGCLSSFGCLSIIIIIPLFVHYWMYKGLKYCIKY